jgi:hypothetical protein
VQVAPSLVPRWLAAGRLPGWRPSLRDVLTWGVDVTSPPRRPLARLLCEHAANARERDALAFLVSRAPGAAAAWDSLVEAQRLTLLDLLALFPSALPPLGALLSALPALPPRYYSLSSSPLAHPARMAVAFSVVEYRCGEGGEGGSTDSASPVGMGGASADATGTDGSGCVTRQGLATSWLEDLCAPLLAAAEASGLAAPSSPTPHSPAFGTLTPMFGPASGPLPSAAAPPQLALRRLAASAAGSSTGLAQMAAAGSGGSSRVPVQTVVSPFEIL